MSDQIKELKGVLSENNVSLSSECFGGKMDPLCCTHCTIACQRYCPVCTVNIDF